MFGAEAAGVLSAIPAGVLVVAGGAKLTRGDRDGLTTVAGLPAAAVRPLGALEAAVGVVCLVDPGRLPLAAMTALYLWFAVFTARLRLRGDPRPCGCLWDDTPADWVHVGVDLAFAVCAAAAALARPAELASLVAGAPALGVPLVLALGCGVLCAVLVLEHLSAALGAYTLGRPRER